jgi:hypothetical protein
LLDLHRLVSEDTLADPAAAGRLRPPGKEERQDIFRVPEDLPVRLPA